jgi:hypothetical protein
MRRWLAVVAVVLAAPLAGPAAAPPDRGKVVPATPKEVAARIDALMAARWREARAMPAPRCDDAEFVRRAYLDLTGRIPDIIAARDFVENPDRDKRAKLVEKLLADERYPVHFANLYRYLLLPDDNPLSAPYRPGMELWLRGQFKENVPYDRTVRELVTGITTTTPGAPGANGGIAFLQANSSQPENLAAATSRLFLGVKLECAQCHNHPSARWTRKQFWEQAAFFTAVRRPFVGRKRGGAFIPPPALGAHEILIPGTDKKVKARFLDGKEPAWRDGVDGRVTYADWLTSPNNPFFARAAANRMWELLLGVGLVDPVDEASPDNPPSHPEVLDELARQFAAHKFDVKFLVRTIVLTRAYQLTSRQTHPSQADARLFARMRVRGLTPEQLYDSLAVATGNESESTSTYPPGFPVPGPVSLARMEFLRRFPNHDRRIEQQTSILQALYLMNGKLIADATSLEHNRNLAIIAEARGVRTSRRVEQLFLIVLNRKPTAAESARLVRYVDRGGPSGDEAKALCDVFWALLNSSEFCVNH